MGQVSYPRGYETLETPGGGRSPEWCTHEDSGGQSVTSGPGDCGIPQADVSILAAVLNAPHGKSLHVPSFYMPWITSFCVPQATAVLRECNKELIGLGCCMAGVIDR